MCDDKCFISTSCIDDEDVDSAVAVPLAEPVEDTEPVADALGDAVAEPAAEADGEPDADSDPDGLGDADCERTVSVFLGVVDTETVIEMVPEFETGAVSVGVRAADGDVDVETDGEGDSEDDNDVVCDSDVECDPDVVPHMVAEFVAELDCAVIVARAEGEMLPEADTDPLAEPHGLGESDGETLLLPHVVEVIDGDVDTLL
jgi:hypothetical protein